MAKELGRGRYQPSVFAFFPKLGRGHSRYNCRACPADAKNHSNQAGNRKDWEESVGIRRSSKQAGKAHREMKHVTAVAADPKGLTASRHEAPNVGV